MPELTPEQQKELEEKIKKMSPEELKEFQKQQCIFCQIVAGKVPAKTVFQDDTCLAVMDINPAAPGHILLLPKEHYAIMPQVPDTVQGHLFMVGKYLSQIMLKVLKVTGTTLFIANGFAAGQRSQHFMLHVIPRKEGDKLLDSPEKLVEQPLQEKIRLVVEPRLNELLGIKAVKNEIEIDRMIEKKEEPKKELPEREEEIVEAAEVPEEVEEQSEPKKLKKELKKKAEKKRLPKESASKEEASLDDIARLFR
ncbi:HIT domain-containing protein [Candidatus Woesearchaeota archaeon]|nr:HIT domain-containing protein [Candidatus Woesearchaeota archaeon]